MPKIFYGNGECELDANDAIYCELQVKYPIRIEDKSPYDFVLQAPEKSKMIIRHHLVDNYYKGIGVVLDNNLVIETLPFKISSVSHFLGRFFTTPIPA